MTHWPRRLCYTMHDLARYFMYGVTIAAVGRCSQACHNEQQQIDNTTYSAISTGTAITGEPLEAAEPCSYRQVDTGRCPPPQS